MSAAMLRLFATLCLMGVLPGVTVAHNPKIATFTLRDTGTGWYIEMNFAQTAVDATMEEKFGREVLASMPPEQYRNEVIDYVKEQFSLRVNGQEVPLGNGGILLGSHETNLKFVLPDLPSHPREATVHIPMFSTTYNHTNLFRIYRGGAHFTKFFLHEDNNFRAEMEFTANGIVAAEPATANNKLAAVAPAAAGGLVTLWLMLYLGMQLRQRKLYLGKKRAT